MAEEKKKWYQKVFKFIIPLVSEDGETLSLGRVSFWIVLGVAVPIWKTCNADIQLYHFYTLLLLAGYNCYSKLINPKFIAFIKVVRGIDTKNE